MSKNSRSTTIHLLLQGKGGVGKSLVASFLAQYFMNRSQPVRCIDIDPLAHTLAQYDRLNVQTFPLIREGDIDPRSFDAVIETPEWAWNIRDGYRSVNIRAFVELHPRTRSHNDSKQPRSASLHSLRHHQRSSRRQRTSIIRQVAESSPSRSIVLWLNEFFGPVATGDIELLEMVCRVLGSVPVPKRNRDIADLLVRKQTFDEALESSDTPTLTKRRLKTLRNELFAQLDCLPMGMEKEKAA